MTPCEWCGRKFELAGNKTQRFCSETCRKWSQNLRLGLSADRIAVPICSDCGQRTGRHGKSSYCDRCRYSRKRRGSRFRHLIAAGGDCHLCGEPTDPAAHWNSDWYPTIDHVMPIALGGRDIQSNVAIAHRWCNTLRGARTVDEFRERISA